MPRNILTYLKAVLQKPTSDSFLQRYGLTHTLLYRDLARFSSLEEAFAGHDHILLLYKGKTDHNGHWTLLMHRGQSVEFFDSYGQPPDHWLKTGWAYLSQLLRTSSLRATYNDFPFQARDSAVASCGQWCALRYSQKRMSLKAFQECFGLKSIPLTRDEFVCLVI